jgi:hypothetical protein
MAANAPEHREVLKLNRQDAKNAEKEEVTVMNADKR